MKQQMRKAVAGLVAVVTMGGAAVAQQAATTPAATPPPPPKTWADSVTVKGDFRYRYESIDDDSKLNSDKETYTRQRDRIRARLGAEAKCNDKAKVGIEFSTGQSDPVSGNQSLGDGFGKKDFKLNLAYLDYKLMSDDYSSLSLVAGKMKNPFFTYPDDLVWDGDLTPEGLAVKGEIEGDVVTFLVNGGYMWVQERSDKDDLMLYAGQGAVKFRFMPELALTLGVSSYAFQNMMSYDVIDWEGKNGSYGNSTKSGTVSGSTTNKAWKFEYEPMVFFASVDMFLFGKPVSLYAQSLSNGEVDNYDAGTLYGASIGKAKNPQTWEIGYSNAELEKDATVGMFTDSDRWGGGTDGKGHKVYGKYQIMKNLQAGVAFFMNDKKISDASKTTDYERLQVDLVASF